MRKIDGISVINAHNNIIYIKKSSNINKINFDGCSNNVIRIAEEAGNGLSVSFVCGGDAKHTTCDCNIEIGEGSTFGGCVIQLCDSGSNVKIGKYCMFSGNIHIMHSDTHTITDLNGKAINRAKDLIIGNHVWCGMNVLILKNTKIGNDCIIGANSVVSGKFLEDNIVIAGNPAKKVRSGINWNRYRIDEYEKIIQCI